MPKASAAKTVSAPKKLLTLLVLIFSIAGVFSLKQKQELIIGSTRFVVEVADTEAARAIGLSRRSSLAPNHAMLFVFPEAKQACFWMKDMLFPIDIIWLDGDKTVFHVEHEISPGSYPWQFCPEGVAKYVVEVNAGLAAKNNVVAGSVLKF